jgi:hypothetical protein
MKTTLRKLGLGALVVFVVLGLAWALEKTPSNSHPQDEVAVSADAAPTPPSFEPTATDSSEEYDRSDLLLSQG